MLVGVNSSRKALAFAMRNQPSLLIDCDSIANPHAFFHEVRMERLGGVYVIGIDIIYGLRDTLKRADRMAAEIGAGCICITLFHHLFNYGNHRENHDVYEHCWELMKSLSSKYKVIVGIHPEQLYLAKRYCDRIIGINN